MSRPLGRALSASVAMHGGFALLAMVVLATRIERVATATPPPRTNLVYIARAATTPMGGGGGHRAETPPTPTTIPPPRPITIDAVTTAVTVTMDPPPTLSAPVQTNLATLLTATGSNSLALPGPGGGGQGVTGAGPGKGPGLGPGENGDTGGGPRRIGGDVSAPVLIRHIRPDYTNEALVARIQGTVELEAVVLANGTLGRITVIKSLHPSLDQQAIVAARKWLFQPGRQNGTAVDVIVTLILEFKLH